MEKGLCLVLLLGLPVFSDAAKTNPSDDQDLIRGKNIFMKYCSACHGPSGQGEGYRLLGPHPADLTSRGTGNNPIAIFSERSMKGNRTCPFGNIAYRNKTAATSWPIFEACKSRPRIVFRVHDNRNEQSSSPMCLRRL